jgi:hypothetical protein
MAVGTYALTTLSNLKNWIGITSVDDDVLLEHAIDRATAIIESHCDRKLKARTFSEWCMPSGERTFTVDNYPIVSIDTISYGSAISMTISSDTASTDVIATVENNGTKIRLRKVVYAGTTELIELAISDYPSTRQLVNYINLSANGWTATLTENALTASLYRFGGRGVIDAPCNFEYPRDNVSEYRVDYDTGLVHIIADRFPGIRSDNASANRFPSGFFPVFVQYTAGFETVPADLEQACIEIAADLYRERKQDKTITSESLGDYNYTQAGVAELLEGRMGKLAGYREIR